MRFFFEPSAAGMRALEYGASECAREFNGEYCPKWQADLNKLAILLRDQIVFINHATHGRSSVLRQIQTVGFLTAGIFPFNRVSGNFY